MPVSSSSQEPRRIASLSPAWTEWVLQIGAEHLLLTRLSKGISPYPGKYRVSVTDATLDLETDARLIQEQRPEFILVEQDSEDLLEGGPEVVTLRSGTFRDVLESVLGLGKRIGMMGETMAAVMELEKSLKLLRDRIGISKRTPEKTLPSVLFLPSLRPPAATDDLVQDLIEMAGGKPTSETSSWDRIRAARPHVVALAIPGGSVEDALEELQESHQELVAIGADRVVAFDGNSLFYRPSPRLYRSIEVLASALHGVDVQAEPWEMRRFASQSRRDL